MEDRGGTDREECVTQPLLGHVERHLGTEHARVEREEAVQVLGEEGDVMDAVNEVHAGDLLTTAPSGGKEAVLDQSQSGSPARRA